MSGQSTCRVAVEYMGLFRICFIAIDIRHSGTINDDVWIVFGENVVKQIVCSEIELRECNVECRLCWVIGFTNIPTPLLTCTYYVTSDKTIGAYD